MNRRIDKMFKNSNKKVRINVWFFGDTDGFCAGGLAEFTVKSEFSDRPIAFAPESSTNIRYFAVIFFKVIGQVSAIRRTDKIRDRTNDEVETRRPIVVARHRTEPL